MKDSFEAFLQRLYELRSRKASLFVGSVHTKIVENLQYSEHFNDEFGTCYVRVSYLEGMKTVHLDSIECRNKGKGWFTALLKVAQMNCQQLVIENVINERLGAFLTRNSFEQKENMCWVWTKPD